MTLWNIECGLESEKPRRPFANLQIYGQDARCCRQQKLEVKPDKENISTSTKTLENARPSLHNELEKFCMDRALLKEVYSSTKVLENKSCPLFRRSAAKISIEMRSAFVDWLIYKAESFELHTSTLHLAVNYADRYFSKEDAGVEDLPVVGSCAIFLASKFEEARDRIPKVDKLIKHASNAFSRKEIFQMEQKMLKALDFKMLIPTIYLFLQIFCDLIKIKDEEAFLAQYLCEIALIFEDVSFNIEPSKIAAASIVLARYLLGMQPQFDDIEDLSGYNTSDLIIISRVLCNKVNKIIGTEFKRVVAKYSSSKYKNVAENSYPIAKYI